jgi:hypothetical protein
MNKILIEEKFGRTYYYTNTPLVRKDVVGRGMTLAELPHHATLPGGLPLESFLKLGELYGVEDVMVYSSSVGIRVEEAYDPNSVETGVINILKGAFHSNLFGVEIVRKST